MNRLSMPTCFDPQHVSNQQASWVKETHLAALQAFADVSHHFICDQMASFLFGASAQFPL